MSRQLMVRPNAHTPHHHVWKAYLDGQLSSSVVSLRDAVERADRNHLCLRVHPSAYDEMVWAGVAKPGFTSDEDYRYFIV